MDMCIDMGMHTGHMYEDMCTGMDVNMCVQVRRDMCKKTYA